MQSSYPHIELNLLHPTISVEEMFTALEKVQELKLASLCVPPFWIKKLRRDWGNENQANLTTVIGFPHGYQRTETKQAEIEHALKDGANDIEVMLNTSAWFSTQNNWVKIEFAKLGKLIHESQAYFTVIIDAQYFDENNLQKAIKAATDAGVDYIKIQDSFNLYKLLKVKQITSNNVGLKLPVNKASETEIKQLLSRGIERLYVSRLPSFKPTTALL